MEIRYLVLFPFIRSVKSLHQFSLRSPKGAPYFFEQDIDVRSFDERKTTIDGIDVTISTQIFDGNVWLYECRYMLPNPHHLDAIERNHKIQLEIQEFLRKPLEVEERSMSEEYTILVITQNKLDPDTYVQENSKMLAGLIRTYYDKTMDAREIKSILFSRARYSEQDLVIVDWNGAVVITDDGDNQSDIDLLKIGNYQLIRYRMLDNVLERKLNYLHDVVTKSKFGWSIRGNRLLQEVVSQRLSILLTFDKLDTSLLLIGDWYSSQLYKLIVEEFYINTWKGIVQTKLESLKSLIEMIRENLTLSWRRVIDEITFVGWFIMMLGYFILFYIDLRKR